MSNWFKRFLLLLSTSLLLLFPVVNQAAGAGCSEYTGRVVINEYNYIENWVELKVLDNTIIDGATNPFTGWNLTIFKDGQKITSTTKSVAAAYPVNGANSCGVSSTQYYVQIPFASSEMDNNVNVVLSDSNNDIVDVFRLDQTALNSYFSGYNACNISYSNLTDGPLLGNSSRKDIARLPDGTGPWVQSLGTGANSENSLCTTNDSMLAITNVASVATVSTNTDFTFTVTVSNGGTTGSLSNVTVTNPIPAGLTYSSAVAGTASISGNATSYDSATGLWTIGTLDATESATLILTVNTATIGTYTSTATAYADELAPGFTTADAVVTVTDNNFDHLQISHTGSGITCTPSEVTVTACADAACSSTYSGSVTTTLTPTGWAGGDTVTFTNGSASYSLWHTATGNVTLGATSTQAANATRCFVGATETCTHTFSSAGLLFSVPTQIANKPSADITISAVKADPADPSACIPGFTGNRSINFWSAYLSPTPYTGSPALSVNGTPIVGTTSPATSTAIDLTFDANAQSTFTTHFADAGKLQLNAQYISTTGQDSGLTMAGSSDFVVTPVGFCVQSNDTNSDCTTTPLAACSKFKPAGASFNLDIIARAWESDTDTDLCTGNATTPNFVHSAIPLSPTLVAPTGAGTSNGTLGVASVAISSGGTTTLANQSISEVGVFTITAAPAANSYLGVSVPPGTSANLGRFYPAGFTTTISDNGTFVAGCPTCTTPFTYLGDSFGYLSSDLPTALITAVNSAGIVTKNYQGDFAKLITNTSATVSLTYPATDNTTNNAAASAKLAVTSTVGDSTLANNGNGTLTLKLGAATMDRFQYSREIISPFVADLSITLNSLNDGDITTTLTTNNIFQPASLQGTTTFNQRYGRAVLSDATGSSATGTVIPIPLALQFYNSSGAFADNVDDTVTTISSTHLDCTDPAITCLAPTVATVGHGGAYTITADGNSRTLQYALDLTSATGANLEYLMHDWDNDTVDDNPTATVILGEYPHYHGEGRFRFWSESN